MTLFRSTCIRCRRRVSVVRRPAAVPVPCRISWRRQLHYHAAPAIVTVDDADGGRHECAGERVA